jgi:hypothetical protein
MKFVHPEILWALGALAIPIIVHLFNFRRFKKVLFSNVAFLKEIQQETKSKSKLKHLLILIARLLALACIIFAFAQPYIPLNDNDLKAGDKAISIYIDNSFSTQAESEGTQILEISKNKAIQIVEAYKPTDKFQLLTNDFEGRHQRLVGQEDMIQLIQEVQVSPATRTVSEVVSRQQDLLINAQQQARTAYLLSDLQANMLDLENVRADSSISFKIIPENSKEIANVTIDSVWFTTPVRQLNNVEQLIVRLKNNGDVARENIPVNLKINGQSKSVASANLDAYQTAEIELSFTNTEPGTKLAEVSIDDHPVVFDNVYNFSYNVAGKIRILNIKGNGVTSDPVGLLFSDDPYYQITSVTENGVDFALLGKNDIVILNQINKLSSGLILELEKFIFNGGSCTLIPSTEGDILSYNELLSKCEAGSITGKFVYGMNPGNPVIAVNYDHFLLKGVLERNNSGNEKIDFPIVGSYIRINMLSQGSVEPIMSLQSNDPFITSARHGGGRLYTCSVTLNPEESNFISHSFFPTLLLRMAEYSQNSDALSYTLGKEQGILLRNVTVSGEQTFRLKDNVTGAEIIPEHRNAGGNTEIFIHSDLRNAGNYSLSLGDSIFSSLSFNYDRKESYTTPLSTDDVNRKLEAAGLKNVELVSSDIESVGQLAGEINEGKKYWYAMIIWGLIFLAIEVLLIKFWR